MERIQAAIQKAKVARGEVETAPAARQPASASAPAPRAGAGETWAALAEFIPDAARMEQARVVTYADVDPAHAVFDMMRTKALRSLHAQGWTALGITSPTVGCGKTTVAMNLAFSFAHQSDLRVVLADVDLRRPSVAQELGLPGERSMAAFLQGGADLGETFMRAGPNLAIGGSTTPSRQSGDLFLSASAGRALAGMRAALAPNVILYDLPPMLANDDAMAFLPHLDAVLLIAGAEKSRLDEVDRCEHELAESGKLLGVVLNMCRYMEHEHGYY
ncbi:CpsD/CapB family tyrosine-protein kinase [Amaricoccus sp.]|uniref:CpsD/CapB family tyrosine-protein kinase n=1 Tax=Amaricoccus sp. TaxID=1872485 RepID=UPI001B7910E9|nr:CpsD/CapB family tyrosine-protein kinase [Amaricoccus sp.]MBP7003137.1 CpsD/CapB family tyrosine-protein kinase [Amaricoccus sp.]